ncbi:MAG: hypothetical protein CMG11_04325 [Candidatus Marinimicrobia bacterium]|nr:hypothetical protein [Candidatus Neomarinimicrobiota bacterium]
MFLKLKSYLFIMIGITILGISLGIVIGAYLKNNAEYMIYFSSILAGTGSFMIVVGALKD